MKGTNSKNNSHPQKDRTNPYSVKISNLNPLTSLHHKKWLTLVLLSLLWIISLMRWKHKLLSLIGLLEISKGRFISWLIIRRNFSTTYPKPSKNSNKKTPNSPNTKNNRICTKNNPSNSKTNSTPNADFSLPTPKITNINFIYPTKEYKNSKFNYKDLRISWRKKSPWENRLRKRWEVGRHWLMSWMRGLMSWLRILKRFKG